ncbi:DNA primase [Qipengyuania sp. JC766]|uniref:DNA primase n=1 Tax=Qipengyuania sp. JC766 TaxID=3232139 RepID=UPI003458FFB6
MALSPQWLDELRARITLSSVVMRTTKLQRAGREWKACCPFHDEKTPSFYVNDQKGFYHCFGCQAHGDVIRWMTDQRGLPFMDAVKELASEAGMEVPAPDPRAARQAEKRASLVDVTTAAQQWFVETMQSPAGEKARAYLESRGITAAMSREFGFGYAPETKQALKDALKGFDERMLVDAGLRVEVEGKAPYDRFRDRLMLPIQDQRGRVIGFGGRILEKREGAPKYLNSPDTQLFDKGRTLYNLHRAAPASRQSGRIIIVEGYMDVIALAQAGIAEAVAPMGTALTELQIELLWRHVETPVLCFDGDAAGQRAAMKAVERALPLLRPSHSLRFVRLPEGLDPDDLVRDRGKAAMAALLDDSESLLDTLWRTERDAVPLRSPEDKAGLKARLLAHVDTIADQDIRALYRRELLDRFSAFAFPRKEWKGGGDGRRFGNNRDASAGRPQVARRDRTASRDALFAATIAGLARHPALVDRHHHALARLAQIDPKAAPAIDFLMENTESLERDGESPILLPDGLVAPPDETRFAFLREGTDPQSARDALAEAVSLLVERPALDAALAAATARFETDPEGAFAEQQRLLRRKREFDGRIGRMASERSAPAAPIDGSTRGAPATHDETTG